jgi:Holliday junction resolvasome RuvABC endonuclease subunit
MSLLALDLGTTIGYALRSSGVIMSGHVDFAPAKTRAFEGGGMRYLRFQRWLNEMHRESPIEEIVFEEVRRHKGVTAAHKYGGFLGVLTAWCEDKDVPYSSVLPGAIKEFATGKQNAKKDEMVAAAKRNWGFEVTDDNEADAIALLHMRLFDIYG